MTFVPKDSMNDSGAATWPTCSPQPQSGQGAGNTSAIQTWTLPERQRTLAAGTATTSAPTIPEARSPRRRRGLWRGWLRWAWLGTCLLLAMVPAGKALWQHHADRPGVQGTSAAGETATTAKPIATIHVGERVWADAPAQSETRVDPATWRWLELRAVTRWEDGTEDMIRVETLQPPEWVQAQGARVGAQVLLPLDLLEMGLPEDLLAEVVAESPCPPIPPGPGQLVLTTVSHLNADLRQVTVVDGNGRQETFRPTGSHRFYRVDDGAWIATSALRPGDRLKGRWGAVRVVAVDRLPGVQRVYNLTVEGQHVYQVSALGVLAHNNGCGQTRTVANEINAGRAPLQAGQHAPAEAHAGRPPLQAGQHAPAEVNAFRPPLQAGQHAPSESRTWLP